MNKEVRFIDVSLSVDENLPSWPSDPPIRMSQFLDMGRGDAVNASSMSCSVHTGTHVDAPRHHFADGSGTDMLALSALIGPAFVADLTGCDRIDARSLERAGLPAGVERVLFKTTNSNLWRDGVGAFDRTYVALTEDAAEWLTAAGVRLVGIDYLSVERFEASVPVVHRTLLQAGTVIVEGLDLTGVAPGPYQLICLPMKLRGLDGAPARAVLVAPDPGEMES